MKKQIFENAMVLHKTIKEMENLKISLLSDFDEELLNPECMQYVLMAVDHLNLAIRNSQLAKLKMK
jgi:hypothetical protein